MRRRVDWLSVAQIRDVLSGPDRGEVALQVSIARRSLTLTCSGSLNPLIGFAVGPSRKPRRAAS